MQIVVDPELKTADNDAIVAGLRAFNRVASGYDGPRGEIGILLKDEVSGATMGGLTASYGAQWMFIKLLFVPEAARGQRLGCKLMTEAEAVARQHQLTGIWLDTFSFQARGFYEKLGYEVFGALANYPGKHERYFLAKLL